MILRRTTPSSALSSEGSVAARGPTVPMKLTSISFFVSRIASSLATSSENIEPIEIPTFSTSRSRGAMSSRYLHHHVERVYLGCI